MGQEQIIKKSYLPGMIISSLFIVTAGLAASGLLLHFDVVRPLDTHYSAVLSILTGLRDTLTATSLKVSIIFTVVVFAGLLCLIVFYTHRIAGPLYRIKVAARQIGEGRLKTEVRFREKDVIHPFADSLTAMTESYSGKLSSLRREIDQLEDALDRCASLLERGEHKETDLQELTAGDARIRGLLSTIKT
jgi:methyl-accepting chemotaxis protein